MSVVNGRQTTLKTRRTPSQQGLGFLSRTPALKEALNMSPRCDFLGVTKDQTSEPEPCWGAPNPSDPRQIHDHGRKGWIDTMAIGYL